MLQPLYIYGPHTGKDCEQWFLDRILRDRPVPIPAPGIQLVGLSHVEDIASMLAKVSLELCMDQAANMAHVITCMLFADIRIRMHSNNSRITPGL